MIQELALFDLAEFEREAIAAQPWAGAPLAYSTEYHHPDELAAAFARYREEFGDFGCLPRSHMWHGSSSSGIEEAPAVEGHDLHLLTADTRCREADHDHSAAPLPDELMYQANCGACHWHHIGASWNDVVEAMHDHALPGWRALPVIPAKLARFDSPTQAKALGRWIEENYPAEWQCPGAPIRTSRGQYAGRDVPGRSPFRGFDLAAN